MLYVPRRGYRHLYERNYTRWSVITEGCPARKRVVCTGQ